MQQSANRPKKKRDFAPFGWCKKCNRNRQWLYFCGCKMMGIVLYCRECYNELHKIDLEGIVQKQMGIKSTEITPWTLNREAVKLFRGPRRG